MSLFVRLGRQHTDETLQSFFYLPQSPTHTKSVLYPRSWYTEREEVIMINVCPTIVPASPVLTDA
jgi:hypothetical protein